MRIYHKPLVLLIWWGPVLMAFGGMLSLSDRRLRVGAPKPARAARAPAGGGMKRAAIILALAAAVIAGSPAHAVQPDEIMADPVKEARARDLSRELRCMVCQNQSIDDSDAPLARDLRLLVRERIAAGDSDSQVIDFLVARYGEFVLLKPRFNPHTRAAVAAAAAGADRRRHRALGLSAAAAQGQGIQPGIGRSETDARKRNGAPGKAAGCRAARPGPTSRILKPLKRLRYSAASGSVYITKI